MMLFPQKPALVAGSWTRKKPQAKRARMARPVSGFAAFVLVLPVPRPWGGQPVCSRIVARAGSQSPGPPLFASNLSLEPGQIGDDRFWIEYPSVEETIWP